MRGLAYTGDLSIQTGDTLPQTPATSCFAWSDNEVTIRYGEPYVGTISSGSGALAIELCSNDTLNPGDQVVYLNRSGGSPTEFIWVLTGIGGQVLGLVNLDSISFETAPPGEYTIYGVTGSPLPDFNLGLQFEAEALDQETCLDVSDTSITVIKTEIAGGEIAYEEGGNVQYFCAGDTLADVVVLDKTNNIGDEYAFLCTDTSGVILAMSQNDSLDVSSLSEGEYSIVGMAYDGMWLAEIGDTLGRSPLSTGCHARSINRLMLVGIIPEGGMVQTSEGETEVDVIVGDGIPDLFTLEAINASPSDYVFVVTDSSDKVLAILPDSTVDFEMVPPGENRVYGVAYTGDLLLDGGEPIMTTMISDDCYDLSDNAVVFHLLPDTSGLQGDLSVLDKPFEMQFFTEGGTNVVQLKREGDRAFGGSVRVFDRSGRQLFQRHFELKGGSRTYRFNPDGRGIELYFIQVILEDGRQWTEKVILLGG